MQFIAICSVWVDDISFFACTIDHKISSKTLNSIHARAITTTTLSSKVEHLDELRSIRLNLTESVWNYAHKFASNSTSAVIKPLIWMLWWSMRLDAKGIGYLRFMINTLIHSFFKSCLWLLFRLYANEMYVYVNVILF